MTAPIPPDEERRLEALRACCVLDTAPETGFDEITAIASELAAMPIALISLVDGDRQWFKSRVGLDAAETPRDLAFCAHAILTPDPLIVMDATRDERFASNPLVTGPMGIRFYAGFPLELSSGERLGTLCVIDKRPRSLSVQQVRILTRLSREAAASLELRRSLERIRQAKEERDDLIARLRATQRDLDAANRAKSAFLANMSHEIRTPMTAILGFLDVLADPEVPDAERAVHMDTIRRNADHLLMVINDILDLSKIEAGKLSLESVETSPVEIAREVETLLGRRAVEKGLAFELDLEPALPRAVRTDPGRLRQILINLVANAIKFTDAGSVRTRVAIDRTQDPAILRVTVEDTGIGLTAEQRRRLFGAFEQGDASTTRRFGGTGLGLRISQQLAELLGGSISVDSVLGRGSVFTLAIPVGPVDGSAPVEPDANGTETAAAATAPTGETRAEEEASALAGARVLLADDGPDNRVLMGLYMRKASAEMTAVSNGTEAIRAVEEHAAAGAPFDLVLMDMQMPEMDGYEAARTLRARGHGVGIIALTANAMAGDRDRCLAAGCDEYVPKPINRTLLLRTCADILARSRDQQNMAA